MKTTRSNARAARSATMPRARLRATALAARAACGSAGGLSFGWSPSVLGLLLLGLMPWSDVLGQAVPQIARTALPTPCSATATCGVPANALPFVGTGSATATVTGNQMRVVQSTGTSLLNWRSFNVGADAGVSFSHTNPAQAFTSINRIHDSTLSTINGRISAPMGQIYLINPNGLLFGSGARVDVASLIASTLDASPAVVQKGLLNSGKGFAAFGLETGTAQQLAASVDFHPDALIEAGNVYVFAHTVNNAGSIRVTPGGQVVLAAGQRVFLAASDSATLRGLLVEVGQGGTVTNSGSISTPRGNTTLVGMAVNQSGSITATSALYDNGSIYLRAREVASGDTATAHEASERTSNDPFTATGYRPTAAGSVTVAAGSSTQVLLDTTDTATAALNDAGANAARSTLVVDGRTVAIGTGDTSRATVLRAKGGDIAVSARGVASMEGTDGVVLGAENTEATLTVADRVTLDVSGERNAHVDGSRNYVYIDRLTSNDLRDAPGQRDGYLRGQGVHVNVAQEHAFIDLSGRRGAVAGTQAERNASAGNISLRAEGRVDVARNAVLDISGGSTQTTAASGRTSQLVTRDGRVVDVMQAQATEEYVGFADRVTVRVNAPREGIDTSTTYEAPRLTALGGFTEGKSAGKVEITAPRGSMAGRIDAQVTRTERQRSDASLLGGALYVGSTGAENLAQQAVKLGAQAQIQRASVLLTDDPASAAALGQDRLIAIDTRMLRQGGIQRLSVVSDGSITVAADSPVDMGAHGSIDFKANAVQVDSNLSARGGSIEIKEIENPGFERRVGEMHFGAGVVLDASGTFSNDFATANGANRNTPVVLNGGSVTVTGRDLDLSQMEAIRVDAGAQVSAAGAVTGGNAGSVTLEASRADEVDVSQADSGRLTLGEGFAQRLSAYGFREGGTLSLKAARITVGGQARSGELQVDTPYFGRGFESFTFTGTDGVTVQGRITGTDGVTVQSQQTFAPQVDRFNADPALRQVADGASLRRALTPQAPLPMQERPVKLTFKATRTKADVAVETGAVIDAGAGGSISLEASRAVRIDGTLKAAGGSVKATLTALKGGAPTYTSTWLPDFAPLHALQLGQNATLDVSGVSRIQADVRGRLSGQVLEGGSVQLNAADGHLAMAEGARIQADGARGQVDLLRNGVLTRTDVASRGGAVAFSAMQSLNVNGQVSAQAGAAGVEGGRLSVRLSGLGGELYKTEIGEAVTSPVFDAWFRQDRVLSIGNTPLALPGVGEAFSAETHAGKGHIDTGLVNASGFDTVWLASANTLEVAPEPNQPFGTVSLTPRGSLTLDAQALRVAPDATLSIRTPGSVAIGFQQPSGTFAANLDGAASGGTGRLHIDARQVDIVGHSVLQGVGQAGITARDDVRLRGVEGSQNRFAGSLAAAGDVEITAAQLTPVTQTDFRIAVVADETGNGTGNTPGRILVAPTVGSTPTEPLSAAGSVELRAAQIEVTGRITAPHGGIDLDAGQSLVVGPAAVLSVAGTQAVPYGTMFNNGAEWSYSATPYDPIPTPPVEVRVASRDGTQVQEKRIRLNGPTVNVAPEAHLNLRGGGDLVAQEFTPGPGGSHDVRLNCVDAPCTGDSKKDVRNPLFALIPTRGDQAAPFDPMIQRDLSRNAAEGGSNLMRIGQTLTLAEGSGVPAGTYTLMPARYAVLPGAYAVQAVAGHADIAPGTRVVEAGGTVVVAGGLGVDGAGLSGNRWSGFRVYNGAQFRKLAELRDHSANSFFPLAAALAGELAPRVPLDAGALSVSAGETLRFSTESIQAAAATARVNGGVQTGRGAEIALSAPQVRVSDFPAALQVPPTPSATLSLSGQALTALNAETLVLGAAATRGDGSAAQRGTLTLDHLANSVTLDGTQTVQAGEVLLAASGTVRVGKGASVASATTQSPTTTLVKATGNRATLHVSQAAATPDIERSPDETGEAGDLLVGDNARIAGRSLRFSASRAQHYAPTLQVAAENLGLSSTDINFGDVPADAPGLNLSTALLAQFAGAGDLSLQSSAGFNVYGNAQVGSVNMRRLTLDGDGIYARSPSASATFTAGDVTLRRSASGDAVASTAEAGTGALTVRAVGGEGASGNIELAGGNFALQGFARQQLTATGQPQAGATPAASRAGTGQVRFSGTGSLTAQGDLTLDAARISAGRAAQHSVTADGVLRTQASSAASAETSNKLGAKLTLNGRQVVHGGRIELPSGQVTLQATGTGTQDDVTLLAGSRLSVAGSTQRFATQTADASAGKATLSATAGAVRALAGSEIDISGAGTDGDAGALALLAAQGTLQLDGRIRTDVNTAADSVALRADISADARTLPNLGTLARALNGGPGLQTLDVRVREGDVLLAASDTLKAKSIRIAADGARADVSPQAKDGQLRIDGRLDASGVRAGRVELHAGESVTLGASSRIDAHSSGEGHEGGTVLVSSRINTQPDNAPRDAIRIEQGAQVDVSGLNGGPASGLSVAQEAARNADWGGTVTLRAPKVGNDVAIRGVGAAAGGEALPSNYLKGARQEVVEATVVNVSAGNVTLNATVTTDTTGATPTTTMATGVLATLSNDLRTYMSTPNRTAMTTRLGRSGVGFANFNLRPGLEVRTLGNITIEGAVRERKPDRGVLEVLSRGVDFTTVGDNGFFWRYGGSSFETSQPGALTLRAGGTLTVTGGLQDGFKQTDALNTVNGRLLPYESGDSWRYQLTGGADLKGAASASVMGAGSPGNVVFNQGAGVGTPSVVPVAQTRSGTGRIDVAAAADILLTGPAVSIFTGGTSSVAGPTFSNEEVRKLDPRFTRHGGSVNLTAGRDITASVLPKQLVNNWLWRVGSREGDLPSANDISTAWWVNAATFVEGVGALGGGDLHVKAGNDINRLSTSVPSNAYLSLDGNTLVSNNRGALSVQAGNSLKGGVHYAQSGELNLRARQVIGENNNSVILAQGDNIARVQASGEATVYGSFNPMWVASLAGTLTSSMLQEDLSSFVTYDADSALRVVSLAGNTSLSGNPSFSNRSQVTAFNSAATIPLDIGQGKAQVTVAVLPPNLDLVSFGGDVSSSGDKWLAPAPSGQLRVLAHRNVSGSGNLAMMDLDPTPAPGSAAEASVPTAQAPVLLSVVLGRKSIVGVVENLTALSRPERHVDVGGLALHAADAQPAAIVARTGGLSGLKIDLPKPLSLTVAEDISGGAQISVQNVSDASVSRIHAGGRFDASVLGEAAPLIQISGPGVAEVLAGSDIDLAKSGGIATRGNLYNEALPEAGATLIVAAGVGRGDDGFARRPNYDGVLSGFMQRDAFAATGAASASLNAEVLGSASWAKALAESDFNHVLDRSRLRTLISPSVLSDKALDLLVLDQVVLNEATQQMGPNPVPRAERAVRVAQLVWNQALAQRAAEGDTSAGATLAWAQGLGEATRMRLGIELAQRVQAITNQRFVNTANTESFAPGYVVLRDLFPALSSDAQALRHFVANNPFAVADNAEALRREVLAGLPAAVAELLAIGLNQPAQLEDPSSAFNRGLAGLDAATLRDAGTRLMASSQQVAGTALDALRARNRVGPNVGTPFASGLDALARAYAPEGPTGQNGISLTQSQVRTEQSGDMALLAPRGGVLLGLTAAKAKKNEEVQKDEFGNEIVTPDEGKTEDQLGLLSFGGGAIVGMVRDNFDVNKSRAFTVAGGDIHLWASQGNVDAGRGPRDATVAPPPRLKVNTSTGEVSVDVSASVSGSGIGALVTRKDQPGSSIRLIAPNGYIDAGEAGIRADAGSVTLGTNLVLNAGNISAGGSVSGGAAVVAPAAPLPQAATSGGQADKEVEKTQKALSASEKEAEERAKKERRKRVTGEFIGFGDD